MMNVSHVVTSAHMSSMAILKETVRAAQLAAQNTQTGSTRKLPNGVAFVMISGAFGQNSFLSKTDPPS